MTLNEYRKLRHEDFYLAVVKRKLDWEDAEHVFVTIPELNVRVTVVELLRMAVGQALIENNEALTDENRKRIEDDVKQTISPNLEDWYHTALVKYEDEYIDLYEMQKLDSSHEIVCIVPFNQYYKENDYSFEEDENDEPYFEMDMEIFDNFVKDYEEGKFN